MALEEPVAIVLEGGSVLPTASLHPGAGLPEGSGFSLRPLRPADAARFAEALNDPIIRYWMHGVPELYTETDALRDLSASDETADGARDPYWVWAMADVQDRLMGKVALSDPDASTLNQSYWLHPEGRGRGWMTTAVKAVTTWASTSPDPGFFTVRANVARDNRASRSVLERAGFVVAETHAEYRMGDGSFAPGLRYVLDLPASV